MNRSGKRRLDASITTQAWVLAGSLATCALLPLGCGTHQESEGGSAVAAVERAGGRIVRESRGDGRTTIMVDLSARPVKDRDLVNLKGIGELNTLRLRHCLITDSGLPHIATLGKFRNLDLEMTQITDEGLKHLATMTSLRALYLGGTRITDDGLVHLQPLTKLWILGLGGTNVSDAGLIQLRHLKALRVLDLKNTSVTDAAVASLRTNLPLARICRDSKEADGVTSAAATAGQSDPTIKR
jgi:hypothetical protein